MTQRARDRRFGARGKWQCPLCIRKFFAKKETLQQHFNQRHDALSYGTPSTKIKSLTACRWNSLQTVTCLNTIFSLGQPQAFKGILGGSVTAMRDHLTRSPSWNKVIRSKKPRTLTPAHLDRQVQLLLDNDMCRHFLLKI